MIKLLQWIFSGLALLVIGFLLGALNKSGADVEIIAPPNIDITYTDFITIYLTLLAVLITVVGMIIAILAFVGWRTFEKRVEEKTDEHMNKLKGDGGLLHEYVRLEVREILYRGVQEIDPEIEAYEKAESERYESDSERGEDS